MVVHITGTMGLPSGAIYPNCTMYFERQVGVVSQGGFAVVPEKTTVTSNGAALVDFYLLFGNYIGTIQTTLGTVKFAFSVLDVATATFTSCIGNVSVPIPADSVAAAAASAAAATAAAATVVSLVNGFDGTIYTTSPSGGRGPYAIAANPVDTRAMTLRVNGLTLSAPDHFQVVVMGAAPSGFGVLFNDDQPVGARVDYRILLPTSATVVGDAFRTGNGSPEGAVTADPGTLYLQRDGLVDGVLWVKNAGSGSTSWVSSRHKYRSRSTPTAYVVATTVPKEVGNATTATSAQFTRISLSAGAAAFDVNVELSLTNATSGDFFDFYINLPSLADRRIIFVNGTVAGGGAVLATMFTAASARYGARFVYSGAAWQAAWINQSVFI